MLSDDDAIDHRLVIILRLVSLMWMTSTEDVVHKFLNVLLSRAVKGRRGH
jgi:hypothetical protein